MSPVAEKLASEIEDSVEEDPKAARILGESRSGKKLNQWAVISAKEEGLQVDKKRGWDELQAPTTNITRLKAVGGFESTPAHERAMVEAALETAVGKTAVVPIVEKILKEKSEEITQEHDLPIYAPKVFVANAIIEASEVIAGAPDAVRDELAEAGEEKGREVVELIVGGALEEKMRAIEAREREKTSKRSVGSQVINATQFDLDGSLLGA